MEQKGLQHREYFPLLHDDGCFGRIVALYIFRKRKWLKIGEYCQRCGETAIFPEFKDGC